MIAIIDYGIGNLGSVKNALDKLNIESVITNDKSVILNADKLILPGVGAFKDAIDTFRNLGFEEVLNEFIKTKKPVLGICVGMQMLFEYSNEFGRHKGLGILKGEIVKFESKPEGKYKIPHMGWNNIKVLKDNPLLKGLDDKYVYFVHSYYLKENEYAIAKSNYCDTDFICAVNKDNIYATQFHPEKSGEVGLEILRNFGEL